MRSHAVVGAAALALFLAAAPVPAQPTSSAGTSATRDHEGEVLERAAAAAFASGDYGFAIHAWLRAHARSGREVLLLDVARANRARFERDGDPRDHADAIATYRRFLRATPPRAAGRAKASRAIAELEAIAIDPATAPREPRRRVTRLGVLSDTLGAEVRVDGGTFSAAPRLSIVSAGKHRVVIRAPNHRPAEREVNISRGGIVALDVSLEPEPAELLITGAEDTAVHIDGQRVQLPEEDGEPLRIAPGEHLVAVTQTGFRPYAQTIELHRGARQTLAVSLEATPQRAAAISLLCVGGLGLTAGVVLGALSVDADRNSRADAAGDYRAASGIVGISGVVVLVSGGTLLILDEPTVPAAPTNTTVSLSPLLGPRRAGVSLTARF